jgi:cytochrome b subunit of formate dehydrogenase
MFKPLAMLGVDRELPPQDKYNAGQKLFAISVLVATTLIITSGLVMGLHLGPPGAVAAAILVHKLAIMLVLVGLSLHLTMALIMREERPALRGMLKGEIDYDHAITHAEKWAAKLEDGSQEQRS